jgi:hypothetical protein
MKKNRRPLVAHALAALALMAASAFLVAGCQRARAPLDLVGMERCDHCVQNNCTSEAMGCAADPARALAKNENGTRCVCLLGCRALQRSVPWCVDHCGPSDPPYDSLRSCIDTNCNDRCPRNEAP